MSTEQQPGDLVTPREAAHALGVTAAAVNGWIRAGLLQAFAADTPPRRLVSLAAARTVRERPHRPPRLLGHHEPQPLNEGARGRRAFDQDGYVSATVAARLLGRSRDSINQLERGGWLRPEPPEVGERYGYRWKLYRRDAVLDAWERSRVTSRTRRPAEVPLEWLLDDDLIDHRQAARLARVSSQTISAWLREGKLAARDEAFRTGDVRRIARASTGPVRDSSPYNDGVYASVDALATLLGASRSLVNNASRREAFATIRRIRIGRSNRTITAYHIEDAREWWRNRER